MLKIPAAAKKRICGESAFTDFRHPREAEGDEEKSEGGGSAVTRRARSPTKGSAQGRTGSGSDVKNKLKIESRM